MQLDRSKWAWTAPKESILSDFELQCDQVWKVEFANSAFFFGFLFGAVFWGVMADKCGRRSMMFASCLASAGCTALNAAAPDYASYLFLRALTGAEPLPLAVSAPASSSATARLLEVLALVTRMHVQPQSSSSLIVVHMSIIVCNASCHLQWRSNPSD